MENKSFYKVQRTAIRAKDLKNKLVLSPITLVVCMINY